MPHTDMNPVLLKPSTDQTSQVILNGKAVGNMSAREYFRSGNKTQLFTEAVKAFHRLEENHNPPVPAGAARPPARPDTKKIIILYNSQE